MNPKTRIFAVLAVAVATSLLGSFAQAQQTQVVTYAQWQAMVQVGSLAGIQPPPYVVVRGCTPEQMIQLRQNRIPCGY